MRHRKNTIVCTFAGFVAVMLYVFLPASARSQDLGGLIEQLGVKEMARDYLRPGVDAVGYSINSGLSHSANVDSGFHIWIGAKLILTYIPESDRTFTAKLPAELIDRGYSPAQFQTATVVGGDGTTITSTDPNYPAIAFPRGTGLNAFFTAMPQVTFGPIIGTEVILRGLPPSRFDDKLGEFSFYGVGLKHELTHYLDVPFDLAILAAMQKFEIGDIVDGSSFAGMAQASVAFGGLTVFGGVGYETYAIDVSYTSEPTAAIPSQTITLDFQRRNLRFAFGGALSLLGLLDLTAEYSFGVQDNLTVGVGLTL
jgi:hypothetical protein